MTGLEAMKEMTARSESVMYVLTMDFRDPLSNTSYPKNPEKESRWQKKAKVVPWSVPKWCHAPHTLMAENLLDEVNNG